MIQGRLQIIMVLGTCSTFPKTLFGKVFVSGYGPLQHSMGWLSSVGCFEATADSFLLDIWEDFNFGFGRYMNHCSTA